MGTFGIISNLQITNTSYYFAGTDAGEYAIGKYTFAGDTLLTNDEQWKESSSITPNASSYRIGADCGNNTPTLYVDGQQVDSVSDSTYTSGNVGLVARSGEQPNGTNVSFDDFVVTNCLKRTRVGILHSILDAGFFAACHRNQDVYDRIYRIAELLL